MSMQQQSWPEFVGRDASEAEALLKPLGLNVQVLPQGSPTTRDLRFDRVRLFVDNNNRIVDTPHTG